jgi:hypothetical protein
VHGMHAVYSVRKLGTGRARARAEEAGARTRFLQLYVLPKVGIVCTRIGRVLKRALALSLRECHLFWPVRLPWAVRRGHRVKSRQITLTGERRTCPN